MLLVQGKCLLNVWDYADRKQYIEAYSKLIKSLICFGKGNLKWQHKRSVLGWLFSDVQRNNLFLINSSGPCICFLCVYTNTYKHVCVHLLCQSHGLWHGPTQKDSTWMSDSICAFIGLTGQLLSTNLHFFFSPFRHNWEESPRMWKQLCKRNLQPHCLSGFQPSQEMAATTAARTAATALLTGNPAVLSIAGICLIGAHPISQEWLNQLAWMILLLRGHKRPGQSCRAVTQAVLRGNS